MSRSQAFQQPPAFSRIPYAPPPIWIAPAGARKVRGCVFRARCSVSRETLDPQGRIEIAADSYYALYVNGQLVATGPARGTRTCNFVDVHSIAEALVQGRNQIAVEVFCNNFPTFHSAPAEPALFLRCGALMTGPQWQVQLAKEYRTEDVEVYTLQIGLSEWRDLRLAPEGWSTFTDHSEWMGAEVINGDALLHQKALFYRDVPPLSITRLMPKAVALEGGLESAPREDVRIATLLTKEPHRPRKLQIEPLLHGRPVTLYPISGEAGATFILDFAQAFLGSFELDIDAPAGTVLDLGYQEAIQNDRLILDPSHYRFADRYFLREGRRQVSNPLRWRGGRFIQIALRDFDRPVVIHRFEVIDQRHPIPSAALFTGDDPFYNDLWQRSLATLSACISDTVTDCPWREMAFWVNDFLAVNRFWLQTTGQHEVLRRSLSLALSQREENGLMGGVCPTNENPFFTLFATHFFLPIALYEYLLFTGDEAFVKQALPEISALIRDCEQYTNADGLLEPPEELWNFVDWAYHFNQLSLQGKNSCVVNWFHVLALDHLALLLNCTEPQRALVYREKAAAIAEKIEEHFWSDAKGCFLEWIEQEHANSPKAGRLTHALAFLSGRVSADKLQPVRQALMRDDLFLPELYMQHFLIEALAQCGEWEAIDALVRTHWGSILATDSPTIWEVNVYEHGKEAFSNTSSLCHAFSLAPLSLLQRYVLGIFPAAPAFRRFHIAPSPMGHTDWEGTVPTPHGVIRVKGSITVAGLQLTLDIPEGCTGLLQDGRELSAGNHHLLLPPATTASTEGAQTPRAELVAASPVAPLGSLG